MPEPKLAPRSPSRSPSRPASPSSTPPTSGASSSATVNEIFLSPRVVDKRAFAEFSEALRALIERAAETSEQLRVAADGAELLRDGAREATAATQLKLDLAARTLADIDERAEQTRTMLDGAAAAAGKLDSVRQQTDRLVDERVAKMQARMQELEQAAEARLARFDKAIAGALARADERIDSLTAAVNSSLTPAMEALGHMCGRAEALLGTHDRGADPSSGADSLAGLVGRAERAGEQAALAMGQLDAVRLRADEAMRILGESLGASAPLVDKAAAAQEDLKGALGQAQGLAGECRDGLARQVEEHRRTIQQCAGELISAVGAAQRDLGAAVRASNDARRAALQTTVTAENVAAHLGALLGQVEPWRGVMLSAPDGAQGAEALPEPLRRMLDAVRTDLRRDLGALAGALHAVADRTGGALGG